MSRRSRLAILLAVAHLSAVVCGASHFVTSATPAGSVCRWYAALSGACNNYGYFAPRVGSRHRARFLLQDEQGVTWSDVLDQTDNPEARLRLTGLIEDPFMSGRAAESPEMRQRLIRSWAATLFTRHPTAESVAIAVEAYIIPEIAEYRAGSRARWMIVYHARVQRQAADRQGVNDE